MLKTVLLTLGSVIAIVVVIGLCLSTHYSASRSVVIQASAEGVFALIGDLKRWPEWEPFSKSDPTTKTTLGDTTTGIGASQSWVGEGNKGRLKFTACDPKIGIEYDVVFTNGEHDSQAKSWMRMSERSQGSVEVLWGMEGEMNMPMVGGYIALFADKFIGPMFEGGLGALKTRAEAKAAEAK